MEETPEQKAQAAIDLAAKAQEAEVKTALGAPAFVKGTNHYVQSIHEGYGRKSFVEVMGVGQIAEDGEDGTHIKRSINLGKKSAHVDDELRIKALDVKKRLQAALFMAKWMTLKGQNQHHYKAQDTLFWKNHVAPILKAYNLTDMSNFVPTIQLGFFFDEYELPLGLYDLFNKFPMKSKICNTPGFSDNTIGLLESDTFTAQSQTQDQVTVTAVGISGHKVVTDDLQEDSDPDVMLPIMADVAKSVKRAWDRALIDGDTTGSHMDSDVTAATDARKAFKGLRKLALANSTYAGFDAEGAEISKNVFDQIILKMGRFSVENSELISVMGVNHGHKLTQGAIPDMLTLHTVGALATLINGKTPPVYGVSPFISQYMRQDLNASGVYANGATGTAVIYANKTRFWIGERAPIKMWMTPSLADADKLYIAAKTRGGFAGVTQAADETSVAIGYNVAR